MTIKAVVGINWGDEGKGRMIDYMAQNADVVVRYQGGNNAGHTVINSFGKFALHLVPSGIFNKKAINILGPGTVINIEALADEIASLEKAGINTKNIKISDRATVCFPFHQAQDTWEEERLKGKAYGSTQKGIAPAYGDRYLKKTMLIGELLDDIYLKERLREIVNWKNMIAEGIYNKKDAISFDETYAWVKKWVNKLEKYICNTTEILETYASEGKNILFEAQLGALRDVTYGIYPFTTSSNTVAAYAPLGGGLFTHPVSEVMGVMKCFSTSVGAGAFVTELPEDEAHTFRKATGEYGATTGRPRKIGHFDAVASKYGAKVQGATEIALTKLDNLSGRDKLYICTHYEIDGVKTTNFDLNFKLERAKPVYIEMEGWSEDITMCRSFSSLPQAAQNYVNKIEELVGCSITYVSVGPERDSLMEINKKQQKAA